MGSSDRIRIGLDARPMQPGFRAHLGRGTGRYTTELTSHLLRLHAEEHLPFSIELATPAAAAPLDQLLVTMLPAGKRTFHSQFVYPRQVARSGVQHMHFFHHGDAPSRPLAPHFVTVLDLIPLRFPDLYRSHKNNLRFRFARFLEYQAIAKASGIFAISEATKRDVIDILDVSPDLIWVTPLAVSEQFNTTDLHTLPAVLEAQGQRPFVLYVGGIDPRKNVPFLCDLMGAYRERNRDRVQPLLVLAGAIASDDQYPKLQRAIRENGLSDQVLELGRVSEGELVALYQRASAFLFPSLYEGFGFPVLEALACGCPVIAGNNSSIPEVAGEAALLMPDKDVSAWVEALESVLNSPQIRDDLAARGAQRAKCFSWEQTARNTIEGYRTFLGLQHPKVTGSSYAQYA